MKLNWKVCAVVVGVVLGSFGAGCADETEAVVIAGPRGFAAIDSDGNGLIVRTEWNGAFVAWDTSRDGYLTPAEYRLAAQSFDTLDTNDDGLVSAAEFDAADTLWDVNGDGELEADELDPYI